MGPYYRATSQGMGQFFENLYQSPILMLGICIVIAGYLAWRWMRNLKN